MTLAWWSGRTWPHRAHDTQTDSAASGFNADIGQNASRASRGDWVIVLGQLRARSWGDPEGERRTVVEVQAEEVGPSLR